QGAPTTRRVPVGTRARGNTSAGGGPKGIRTLVWNSDTRLQRTVVGGRAVSARLNVPREYATSPVHRMDQLGELRGVSWPQPDAQRRHGFERRDDLKNGAGGRIEPVDQDARAARRPIPGELDGVRDGAPVRHERRQDVLDPRVVWLAVVAEESGHLDLDP